MKNVDETLFKSSPESQKKTNGEKKILVYDRNGRFGNNMLF